MTKDLREILDPDAKESIESIHGLQRNLYGVHAPPSLKQLICLRHLLISTGKLEEVGSEELLGLSKIECTMLLKKLNSIHLAKRYGRCSYEGDGVEQFDTVGHSFKQRQEGIQKQRH